MSGPIRPLLDQLEVPATFAAVAVASVAALGKPAAGPSFSPFTDRRLAAGVVPGAPVRRCPQRGAGSERGVFLLGGCVPGAATGRVRPPHWRAVPPPQSPTWPTLISWEVGKITQEALGEVQEMIDMCDFAVGLSRQLYGLTIASERPRHRLAEQWHPLGPVGVITAFNFPVAVWAWNAMLALVCGDSVVWKPSEKAPLCAMACQAIAARVLAEMPEVPPGLLSLVVGDGADLARRSPHRNHCR